MTLVSIFPDQACSEEPHTWVRDLRGVTMRRYPWANVIWRCKNCHYIKVEH